MNNQPIILFDMDGVILDSAGAIVASLEKAFSILGLKSPPQSELRHYVGPPLHSMISQLITDASDEQIRLFTLVYRQHNNEFGPDLTPIFSGVPELLEKLVAHFDLRVATSKLETSAVAILESKKLDSYFSGVYGTSNNQLDTKTDIIARACYKTGSQNVLAMIGDRVHDIIGAQENQLLSIGVTWGYAKTGELTAAQPNFIVESPEGLYALLKSIA